MRSAPDLGIPIPIPFPHPHIDIAGSILNAIGGALARGMQSIAAWTFDGMTNALLATTHVDVGGWFDAPWRAMLAVAAVLAIPILLVGVGAEVVAGRPAAAVRRGVLIPLVIGPALLAARTVLALLLTVIDGCCALVVRLGIGGPGGFAHGLDQIRHTLGVTGGAVVGGNGVVLLLVVLVTAFLAFVIWIELAVRAALLYLLVAFIPLALAGLFWSATARWTRRLLEVIAAVLLAQLVITVVMVLAAASLSGHADGLAAGIDHVAVGLALLFLGTLGLPMTLRLLPHVVEASAAAGMGAGVATAMRRHSGQLMMAVPHPAARLAGGAISGRTDLISMGSRAAVATPPTSRSTAGQPAPSTSTSGKGETP